MNKNLAKRVKLLIDGLNGDGKHEHLILALRDWVNNLITYNVMGKNDDELSILVNYIEGLNKDDLNRSQQIMMTLSIKNYYTYLSK